MTTAIIAKIVVFLTGAFLTMVGLGTSVFAYSHDTEVAPPGKTGLIVGGLLVMMGAGLTGLVVLR
jgi:hypothetical protein